MKFMNAVLSLILLGALASTVTADDAVGESPHAFSVNVRIATEYLYRGISQSNEDPALQGGFDYAYEPLGLYMGFWASSIEFNAMTTNTSSIETNFYGGFAGEFPIGVSWDIGGLYYYYPDTNEDIGADYNFVELYGNLGYSFEATARTNAGYRLCLVARFLRRRWRRFVPAQQAQFHAALQLRGLYPVRLPGGRW